MRSSGSHNTSLSLVNEAAATKAAAEAAAAAAAAAAAEAKAQGSGLVQIDAAKRTAEDAATALKVAEDAATALKVAENEALELIRNKHIALISDLNSSLLTAHFISWNNDKSYLASQELDQEINLLISLITNLINMTNNPILEVLKATEAQITAKEAAEEAAEEAAAEAKAAKAAEAALASEAAEEAAVVVKEGAAEKAALALAAAISVKEAVEAVEENIYSMHSAPLVETLIKVQQKKAAAEEKRVFTVKHLIAGLSKEMAEFQNAILSALNFPGLQEAVMTEWVGGVIKVQDDGALDGSMEQTISDKIFPLCASSVIFTQPVTTFDINQLRLFDFLVMNNAQLQDLYQESDKINEDITVSSSTVKNFLSIVKKKVVYDKVGFTYNILIQALNGALVRENNKLNLGGPSTRQQSALREAETRLTAAQEDVNRLLTTSSLNTNWFFSSSQGHHTRALLEANTCLATAQAEVNRLQPKAQQEKVDRIKDIIQSLDLQIRTFNDAILDALKYPDLQEKVMTKWVCKAKTNVDTTASIGDEGQAPSVDQKVMRQQERERIVNSLYQVNESFSDGNEQRPIVSEDGLEELFNLLVMKDPDLQPLISQYDQLNTSRTEWDSIGKPTGGITGQEGGSQIPPVDQKVMSLKERITNSLKLACDSSIDGNVQAPIVIEDDLLKFSDLLLFMNKDQLQSLLGDEKSLSSATERNDTRIKFADLIKYEIEMRCTEERREPAIGLPRSSPSPSL